ncbi:aminopeptidase N [Alteromonas pelagimontana]|uniref:Aminopeptidase N n=1 Tax=Alteromonas pelagimontana TaxID=1858656 RepID=A0A6M4MHW7_9ALTE|nr:aminopeptidase N [Alteromonas pelagimontana]QJR82607.1 aminopeptidase N [Alteromonas pelagimontana]
MTIKTKRRADYMPPAFTISDVKMDVVLHPTAARITSYLTVKRLGNHHEKLILDGEKLVLNSVKIDGKITQDYEQTDSSLSIPNVPNSFQLEVITTIDPENNKALEGLYLSSGVYCTQCEAEGFRRITYFLDRPDVLATYEVTLHGNKNKYPTLLANGNPIARGEGDNGSHWVTWQDPHPKPCYLFAMVAGDFDVLTDEYTTTSGRKVALELYVDKGKKARGPFALESLKRAMKWDEDTYGLEYDLDIYMIVAVDFFNMGAMENKGLNIFNSKFVLADQNSATDEDFFNVESVIAHEYFHNWTGNRVTCRDWFQLSLKEGLTVFRDQQFSADMTSPLSNRIKHVRVMREHQFAEDASAMSHPIRPDEVMEMNNFYTVTVYDKGAEVIRMLHTLLGKKKFRKGMDEYFRRHDGQAVTCDDFVAAMQSVTELDLSHFALWYSQSGTPLITVSHQYDETAKRMSVTLSQHTPKTADQSVKRPLFMPVAFDCIDSKGNHYQDDEQRVKNNMLLLNEPSVTLQFSDVTSALIPVVLGNFSAPAKVKNPLPSEDLLAIFRFARDAFNRWDALQQLYDWCIEQYALGKPEAVTASIWDGLKEVVEREAQNHELLGECLVIPSFETLCQSRSLVDVEQLRQARRAFCQDFAQELATPLLTVYKNIHTGDYEYTLEAVNARRCRNVVLNHLARLPQGQELVCKQFNSSDNMTDTMGALKAAQHGDKEQFEKLLASFEQQWREEPLVLDKWFALHATQERDDILSHITLLREHPQFSIGNPNRVRALIGSFAFYNTAGFHAIDGSGYKFVTDYLLMLDKTNPQVAARIVTPLTQWQNYAPVYQEKMKVQLGRLLNEKGLSRDLFEKVSKSLAYDTPSQ